MATVILTLICVIVAVIAAYQILKVGLLNAKIAQQEKTITELNDKISSERDLYQDKIAQKELKIESLERFYIDLSQKNKEQETIIIAKLKEDDFRRNSGGTKEDKNSDQAE